MKKTGHNVKCKTCNKEFYAGGYLFTINKGIYCSHACAKIGKPPWNKGLKTGIIPKTSFKKGMKPWNYLDGRSKFLNSARYGDDWDKIRYLVYLRDKFTCQECGITKKLHIHHITPFLVSFDNSLGNLITLCESCHRKKDAKLIKDKLNYPMIIMNVRR